VDAGLLGLGGDGFAFTAGYWGPVVGFYGGINYGFGYFGHGYEGGRWDRGHFYYNTTVNRVNVEVIHNVYNTRVTETTVNRVSYNGGNGGINARPRPEEEAAARGRHIAPVSAQVQHERTARTDRQQWASVNHGAPAVAATPKPGGFRDSGAVKTREAGGPYKPGRDRKIILRDRTTGRYDPTTTLLARRIMVRDRRPIRTTCRV